MNGRRPLAHNPGVGQEAIPHTLTPSVDSAVTARAREARLLLDQGRAAEAADGLERLLLRAPDDPAVRETLMLARAALAEQRRSAEVALDEAFAAAEAGDLAQAEACAARAGAADPARLALLRDRLDVRPGRASFDPARSAAERVVAAVRPASFAWSRRALGFGFALALGVGLLFASAGWARFVDSLVEPPRPRTRAAALPSLARSTNAPAPAPAAAAAAGLR